LQTLNLNVMENLSEQRFQPSQVPPPNYLVYAILTTVFCCLPFGVVSIIFAAQVNSKWFTGDIEGANSASKNAKIWAWVAFAFGVVGAIIGIIVAIVGVFAGIMSEGFDF